MTRGGAQVGALGTLEEKGRQEVSRQKQIDMWPTVSGRWEAAGYMTEADSGFIKLMNGVWEASLRSTVRDSE